MALIKACRATWQQLRPYWATALVHILCRRVDCKDVEAVKRVRDRVHLACSQPVEAVQVVRGLLEHAPADVPARLLRAWAGEGNLTAVGEALPLVRDVNATDNLGRTALMHASFSNRVEVVRALLEQPGLAVK